MLPFIGDLVELGSLGVFVAFIAVIALLGKAVGAG